MFAHHTFLNLARIPNQKKECVCVCVCVERRVKAAQRNFFEVFEIFCDNAPRKKVKVEPWSLRSSGIRPVMFSAISFIFDISELNSQKLNKNIETKTKVSSK